MKKKGIYAVGLLGTLCDHISTRIGLTYPEIEEMNPLANPVLEGATVLSGQALIFKLGEKLKVSPRLKNGLTLVPALVPLLAATNNVIRITQVVRSRPLPPEFEAMPRVGRLYDFAELRGWKRVMKLCARARNPALLPLRR